MRYGLCVLLLLVVLPGGWAAHSVVTDVGRGNWEAWPDVCRLANGELFCVFIGGSSPATEGNGIFGIRSKDEGRTWSQPVVVLDTARREQEANITQLSDGRVVLAYWCLDLNDAYLLWSHDGGHTWTEPESQKLPRMAAPYDTALYVSDPVRELRDGTLAVAVYGHHNVRPYFFLSGVSRSTDGGKTWHTVSIPNPEERWLPEPGMAQALDGSLWMFIRPCGYFSRSTDRGKRWSAPSFVDYPSWGAFTGDAPYLLFTSKGDAVLAVRRGQCWQFHDDRTTYCPQITNSRDGGQTWSTWQLIDADTDMGGYCSMVELPSDRILCMYYADRLKGYRPEENDSADIRQVFCFSGTAGMRMLGANEYPHEFTAGWEMVGRPTKQACPELETIVRSQTSLAWSRGAKAYHPATTKEALDGAVWTRTVSPKFISVQSSTIPSTSTLTLAKGWNMVSTRLLGAVPWHPARVRVSVANAIAPYAYTWNSPALRYDLVAPLDSEVPADARQFLPWKGYWLYAHRACRLTFSPGAARPIKPLSQRSALQDLPTQLRLPLSLRRNGVVVSEASIGIANRNSVALLAPPPLPDTAGQLTCGPVGAAEYLCDLRQKGPQEWDVVAIAQQPGTYSLRWGRGDASSLGMNLSITDASGKSTDLCSAGSVEWRSARAPTRTVFRVRLGTRLPLSLVATSAVAHGRSLTLSCKLSGPADIEIHITNLSGVPVTKPLHRVLSGGNQSIVAALVGTTGAPLPAGRYLCSVTARDSNGAQTTSLCPVTLRP